MITLLVNGTRLQTDAGVDTPLLWVLRDHLHMTGTKFGCGAGLCGACTVLVDGDPKRSCITPVGDVQDRAITTIEGIPENHPLKQAWLAEEVSQCGYCQPGQIMSAVALMARTPKPADADIDRAMSGNLCRCGTYGRIRRAIHTASGTKPAKRGKTP
ncbi:MAG: (2Fe-2S)-binding protein [Geobacteraceae bacterium GWC2_53_11]|nr:MAG: (2Fe-2S)-binding protein [Geobacteraceae bacterium GWC2_53_11]